VSPSGLRDATGVLADRKVSIQFPRNNRQKRLQKPLAPCSLLMWGGLPPAPFTRGEVSARESESFVARYSGSKRNPPVSAWTPSVSLRTRDFDRHQKTCKSPAKPAKTKTAGRAFSGPSLLTAVCRSFVADQSAPRVKHSSNIRARLSAREDPHDRDQRLEITANSELTDGAM
jgi:hypothetical protein